MHLILIKGTDIAVLYKKSLAICEHMVLPATVIFLTLPLPNLVLKLATPEGCKAELTWMVVILQACKRGLTTSEMYKQCHGRWFDPRLKVANPKS